MTDKLVNLLKAAIELEVSGSIRYLWQYVTLGQALDPGLRETFKDSSIGKLKRGMALGERLFFFENVPTTQLAPLHVGVSLKEMIEVDLKAENEAISKYKEIIGVATEEEDRHTKSLCEKVLAEEEQLKRILMCERGRLHTKLIK